MSSQSHVPLNIDLMNDEQLMSIYCQQSDINNQRAFAVLYARHKGPLYRFIKKSINNEQDLNELFQDLWFKIINNKQQFNTQHKFTTWAYTIARRLLIDVFRKQGNTPHQISDEQIELSDKPLKQPDNEFESKQMANLMSEAINQLPLAQRQTFVMRHNSELTMQEIADINDQPLEKTKSQYRYAVNKIKMALERFK